MTEIVKVPDYTASPRQTLFHTSTAFERFYGGAAGGGKTAALVAEAVTRCLEYDHYAAYLFRRTYEDTKKTLMREIDKQCRAYIKDGNMIFRSQEKGYYFTATESWIYLCYYNHEDDFNHYQGSEIHMLGIDELTQFYESWYDNLVGRVRSDDPDKPLTVFAAGNPGGVGHGWVKTRFIDAAPPEQIIYDKRPYVKRDGSIDYIQTTRMFIPATLEDHPSASFRQSYMRSLLTMADPKKREAYLYGNWDLFAGQAFSEWRRHLHVVEPFNIPDHWPRWMAYDYGRGTYAGAVWLARDPISQRIYLYREYYVSGKGPRIQAREMKQLEQSNEQLPVRLADPSLWKHIANADDGKTIADRFTEEGINFTPANNDRLQGVTAVHEALSLAPDGLPYLQVFSNCVHFIRTLPSLVVDTKRPEDVDTTGEDHLYDALRYGLVNERKATVEDSMPQSDPGLFSDGGYYG
jgi:hypothetical protein